MWLSSIILKLSKLPKDHLWSMYLKCSMILHWICTFLSPELLLPGSYILIRRWRVFPQAGSKCYRLPEIEFYDCVTLYDIAPLWSFSMIIIPAWFIANNLWIEKVFKVVFRKKTFLLFYLYILGQKTVFCLVQPYSTVNKSVRNLRSISPSLLWIASNLFYPCHSVILQWYSLTSARF